METPQGKVYPAVAFVPARVFYSQQGEDLEVFVDFFKDKPIDRGIYVEVGAGNGVEFSNTLFFEKSLGWGGVLVEPLPQFKQVLATLRSPETNYVASCAAGSDQGSATFSVNLEKWAQSHRTDIATEELHLQLRSGNPEHNELISVQVELLSQILEDAEVTYIDLMFVDVEGGELEVLEGMNWDIPVHVIVMECTEVVCDITQRRVHQARQILQDQGFIFHKVVGCNEVWHCKEYPSKRGEYLSNLSTDVTPGVHKP
jgi:FkbM family methyltransferase